MPEQLAVLANGVVGGSGNDERDSHSEILFYYFVQPGAFVSSWLFILPQRLKVNKVAQRKILTQQRVLLFPDEIHNSAIQNLHK